MNKKVQQKHNQIKNRMGRLTDKEFFSVSILSWHHVKICQIVGTEE